MANRRSLSGNDGPMPNTAAGGAPTGRPGQGAQRQQPQLPQQAMIPTPIPPAMTPDAAAHAAQQFGGGGAGGYGVGGGAGSAPGMPGEPGDMMQQMLQKILGAGAGSGGY